MQSTGGGAGGYNHNPGMPVHKEASKESSLEGGNEVAEKDDKGKEEALNPNSSIVDGAFYKQLPPSQGSSYYTAHQGTN